MQFKIGDKVQYKDGSLVGEVLYVHRSGECSVLFGDTLRLCQVGSLRLALDLDIKVFLERKGWTFEDDQDFMTYLMFAKHDLKLVFEALGVDDIAQFTLKGARDIENSTALAYDLVRALFDYYQQSGLTVNEFRVNDRVKLKDSCTTSYIPVNSLGTLIARENAIEWLVDFDDHGSACVHTIDLELMKHWEDE